MNKPPDPTISPDGQWRWDGQRWIPNTPAPTSPLPRKGHKMRNLGIGCGSVIAFFALIGIITAAASPKSQPSASKPTPAAAATPAAKPAATPKPATPAPAPKVLFDQSGTGNAELPTVDLPSHYKVDYSFDCTGNQFTAQGGNFALIPQDQNGNSIAGPLANRLAPQGQGTADGYGLGTSKGAHLQVLSECAWHVKATSA